MSKLNNIVLIFFVVFALFFYSMSKVLYACVQMCELLQSCTFFDFTAGVLEVKPSQEKDEVKEQQQEKGEAAGDNTNDVEGREENKEIADDDDRDAEQPDELKLIERKYKLERARTFATISMPFCDNFRFLSLCDTINS